MLGMPLPAKSCSKLVDESVNHGIMHKSVFFSQVCLFCSRFDWCVKVAVKLFCDMVH